jgi:hypothetical protein
MKNSNIYLFNMIQSSRSHKDHIMGERDEPQELPVEPSAPGENYSLLIIGDSKVDGDGSEVDGDGRDDDGDRWRWLRGHFSIPAGCRNPKIWLRWRRSYRTVLEILPTLLGFSVLRLYTGEGASSGGCQGLLTHRGHGQGLGHAALV